MAGDPRRRILRREHPRRGPGARGPPVRRPHDDRFGEAEWKPAPHSGAPILTGSAAWLDCTIESTHAAGDHVFVLGRVLDLGVLADTAPLVFFRGQYHQLR